MFLRVGGVFLRTLLESDALVSGCLIGDGEGVCAYDVASETSIAQPVRFARVVVPLGLACNAGLVTRQCFSS